MCRPENLQPPGVRHAKPGAARRGAARRRAGPRASRAASPGANRADRQPEPQTPAVHRGGGAAQRPGRRFGESRIASSIPSATPRHLPKSDSLLSLFSLPPCPMIGPRNTRRSPSTDGAERGFRGEGQEGAATLTCNLLKLPGPVQATCPGDSGLRQTR